ncbi:hypothetical protein MNBD_GAMMA02-601 [hydrothermal vent metagenome]|uniref:Uncharacterized protein n=1 Tax=hydrothermal vent metagenome TaxID=652676 RepID=A0A3B0VKA4_9ZZZZ
MKSFKTYLTTYLALGALVFSVSAMADRSRDGVSYNNKNKVNKSQRHVQKHSGNKHQHNNRNNGYKGQHSARQQVRSNNHGSSPSYNDRVYNGKGNKHRNNQSYNDRLYRGSGNRHNNNQRGFNGDYRNNRHFDNSNRRYNSYGHNGGHISHNYYKPKKYYKKWKKQNRRHWKNKYHHFNNYNAYSNDQYRYRPVRGLGHYFDRPSYGYGHWHEGAWCASYHDERFYQDYYSYYPYQNGWRHGDGDFGIWFSL